MDLWDMLKVAVRRWRVLVPLLVLTLVATVLISGRIDPEYTASGSLLLVGPSTAAQAPDQQPDQPGSPTTTEPPAQVNPYLSFSSSLPVTAQALALRLNSAQTKADMADRGLSTSYEVIANERSPILAVEARAENSETAVGTLNRLIDVAGEDLVTLQETRGAPQSQLVNVDVLDQNTDASQDSGTLNRVRLMVLGLGVAASVVAAYATEGIAAWRRQRRLRRQLAPESPGRHRLGGRQAGPEEPAWDESPDGGQGGGPNGGPGGPDRWEHVPAAAVPAAVPAPGAAPEDHERAPSHPDGHWVTQGR